MARPRSPEDPKRWPQPCGRCGGHYQLVVTWPDARAAILAKTLGIHVQAAIQWQKISAGDWAAYAADVGARLEH